MAILGCSYSEFALNGSALQAPQRLWLIRWDKILDTGEVPKIYSAIENVAKEFP